MNEERPRLVGGVFRMEVGLGNLLNLLALVGAIVTAVLAYEKQVSEQDQHLALLDQKLSIFESTTQAQLETITAQTTNLPVTQAQLDAVAAHAHAIDGRLDADENRIGVLEQRQSATDAELQGIVRASAPPDRSRR